MGEMMGSRSRSRLGFRFNKFLGNFHMFDLFGAVKFEEVRQVVLMRSFGLRRALISSALSSKKLV